MLLKRTLSTILSFMLIFTMIPEIAYAGIEEKVDENNLINVH